MYEYVRSGITGQPVRAPRVPLGAAFKRFGGHKSIPSIAVSDRRVVSGENPSEQGAATRHVSTITGATNASPQAWGGMISRPFGTASLFRAAADFSAERYNAHINVKETFALHEVLTLALTTHPSFFKGSTAVDDVDNEAMHDACKKERPRNAQTHDRIKKLTWHQLEEDLTLELRWVCPEENCLTRPEHTEHARLS